MNLLLWIIIAIFVSLGFGMGFAIAFWAWAEDKTDQEKKRLYNKCLIKKQES